MLQRTSLLRRAPLLPSPEESHALLQQIMQDRKMRRADMVRILQRNLGLQVSISTLYRWLGPKYVPQRGGGIQLLAKLMLSLDEAYDELQEGNTDGDEPAAATVSN